MKSPDTVALLERWNEAIENCQIYLRDNELKEIREFHGPDALVSDLRTRFAESAQGKLKGLVSQISPFFDILQKVFLLFTFVMPIKSPSLALVSGGAYLTVKKCAEFDSASKGIVSILDKIKDQLLLFHKYSETLDPPGACRQALVQVFIALIKFWVESLRFLSRNTQGQVGNRIITNRWPTLYQKFLLSLQNIQEAVSFVQKLQEVEVNTWAKKVADAQKQMVSNSPDTDLSEASFPCYEIPTLDKTFLGRKDELEILSERLTGGSTDSLEKIVISGMGGIGKSAIALMACHQCKANTSYDSIFWLNAENEDVLRESFTRIALRLLLKGATNKSDKDRNFMLAKNWLDKTAKSWLLVYDNVDDFDLLERFLPPERGTIIITTRFPTVSFAFSDQPLQLDKLSPEDSLRLFNSLRRLRHPQADTKGEEKATKELLEMVDGLALGIRQMAFYIASKRMTVAKFQERYDQKARYILDSKAPASPHTLNTLWNIQFEDLVDSDASKLLGFVALCNPDDIPVELFEIDEPIQHSRAKWAGFCEDHNRVEAAIDKLQQTALIDVEEGGELLSLHRLTQEAYIYNGHGLLGGTKIQMAFDGLVALINLQLPGYGGAVSLLDNWATYSRYLPHVTAVIKVFTRFRNAKTSENSVQASEAFTELLRKASWYLHEIGMIWEARKMAFLGIETCEDKNSLTFAYLCNTIVSGASEINHLSDGVEYSLKAIAIRESKLEPEDIDIAISHNNYANALLNKGDFENCLAHHALSDSIWIDKGMEDHAYHGLTYFNTGRAYLLRGDQTAATRSLKKAEEIFSKLSNTLFFVNIEYTWGVLFMNHGDSLGALGKFRRALELAKANSPNRLLVCAIHYKLGVLNMNLGLPLADTRGHLESAMTLAIYHQREAEMARIGRQIALAISRDPSVSEEDRKYGESQAATAKEIKDRLWGAMRAYFPDQVRSEEQEYDCLVAAIYR